jgi:hypothetical protein
LSAESVSTRLVVQAELASEVSVADPVSDAALEDTEDDVEDTEDDVEDTEDDVEDTEDDVEDTLELVVDVSAPVDELAASTPVSVTLACEELVLVLAESETVALLLALLLVASPDCASLLTLPLSWVVELSAAPVAPLSPEHALRSVRTLATERMRCFITELRSIGLEVTQLPMTRKCSNRNRRVTFGLKTIPEFRSPSILAVESHGKINCHQIVSKSF